MFRSKPGVQRPLLYVLAAVLAVAVAIPLAVSTGQATVGGIFDECFDADCSGAPLYASAE